MNVTKRNPNLIIIITGPPGAGKTTLGKRLADKLQLPFIGKDDFKDILFDTLGWEDRQWSMKLGQASFEILFHSLECQLKADKSAVVETAFIPQYHDARFLALQDQYGYKAVQIVCYADKKVLYDRFIRRTAFKERHPGHVDQLTSYDQFADLLHTRQYGVLNIEGPIFEIDTTDFTVVDYERLIEDVVSLTNHCT